MKTLIVLVFTALMLTSCYQTPPRINVRIIETGEKATVDNTDSLYASGDTVQVHYSLGMDKWVMDEMWINFEGNKKVFQTSITYKAVVIN